VLHCELVPQRQLPVVEQLSERTGSQAVQVAPSAPQLSSDRDWQVAPAQQPLGHATTSQTQLPETQCRPELQAGLLPHWQSPADEQLSALVVSQTAHPSPPLPQALTTGGVVQVLPEQQPLPQLPELQPLHTPPLQVPGEHDWQPLPPVPHAVLSVPARHVVPAQHPFEHEAGLQTHALLTQFWPAPHAAEAPQRHAPLVEQLLALAGSHTMQLAPPVPHVASALVLQVLPVQHPLEQELTLQTQTPPEQS